MEVVQKNGVKVFANQSAWLFGYLVGGLYEAVKKILILSAKVLYQTSTGVFNLFFGWIGFFMRSPALAIAMLGFFIYGGITVLEKVGIHFDNNPHSSSHHRH